MDGISSGAAPGSDMPGVGNYPLKYIHMEDGVNTALISSNVDIADLSMNEAVSDHAKSAFQNPTMLAV